MDMIENGIVDPTKVTRSSLENAASISACVLTTESLVADKPAPEADAAAMAAAAQAGGMYYDIKKKHPERGAFLIDNYLHHPDVLCHCEPVRTLAWQSPS